jgi:hypothetical protein
LMTKTKGDSVPFTAKMKTFEEYTNNNSPKWQPVLWLSSDTLPNLFQFP